jgi:hypothetical protein
MNSKSLFAAFVVASFMLVGSAFAHPHEGKYEGPYIVVGSTAGTTNGKMALEVGHDGKVVGKGENLTQHVKFDIIGMLDEDGIFKGDLKGAGFSIHLEGTAWKTTHDHLKGTLLQFTSPTHSDGAITLDLTKK